MALFTQLDADLVSNLVELASSPDCPDDELTIDEASFLDGSAQDRHVYASFEQGAWPASPDRQTWVREVVCRVGKGRMHESARSLWARIHFEGSNGAEDDYVLGMRVDGKEHIEWYEEQLSRGLALHDGVCEVWVPPPPPEKLKKDAWWSKHYLKPGHEDGSISYQTYRTYIDDVILDAIQDFDALPLNGRVLELCAGDGAFMERLLGRRPDVASYVFVERNADLCRRARDRCASAIVEGLCVDACDHTGDTATWDMIEPPDVVIASGSVLCGQVGSPAMAEPVLKAVAALLKPTSLFVVTGFTQSYLNPALLARHGLEVRRGSVSTDAVGGLSSGFGRFHLLALRRRAAPLEPSLRDALLPPSIEESVRKVTISE
uniref:Methyltransferase domain-containing protein n=1 Tax=Pelagomonas calceolata TaxID=35677 RepID=A0A7S3ZK44_9STRA